VLYLFLIFLFAYYLLKDGDEIYAKALYLLNLNSTTRQRLQARIDSALKGLFYGTFIIALIQAALAALVFLALGIKVWLLLSIIVLIFALIPVLGPWLVWLPTSIFLILVGLEDGSWWKGIVLILYGFFAVSSIDNILGPKILSQKSGIHPIFVIAGIIGGIALFGLFGIIMGPFILVIIYDIIEIEVG
jgi:predicted PurR-regulated permease PerM